MAYSDAIGIIEAVGFPTAVACADAAVKAANVTLIGYELSRGPAGMVTVKLSGNIGAIQAAVAVACATAEKVGGIAGKLIIPRPHADLGKIIFSPETVLAIDDHIEAAVEKNVETSETANEAEVSENEIVELNAKEPEIKQETAEKKATCNICGDPSCPRHKGEPHGICIHAHD